MMSPGQASSTVSRSCAKNRIGLCTPSVLCVPDWVSFMPRRKRPEHRRRKATRSRWLGSMLAWTLNTKPVTSLSDGSTMRARVGAGPGGGAFVASALNRSRTPKFLSAEPKNTGV